MVLSDGIVVTLVIIIAIVENVHLPQPFDLSLTWYLGVCELGLVLSRVTLGPRVCVRSGGARSGHLDYMALDLASAVLSDIPNLVVIGVHLLQFVVVQVLREVPLCVG